MEMRCNLLQKLFSYKRHYNFLSKRTLLAILILIFSLPMFAAFSPRGIPDSSNIRAKLIEAWFEAPFDMVRLNTTEHYTSIDGNVFEVRAEETDDIFAIIVAPKKRLSMTVQDTFGNLKQEVQEVFPADAPGSWVLLREKSSGKPLAVKFYFAYDSDVFVQITPTPQQTSSVDFIIYNMFAARGVPLRLPFERFYSASIASLFGWTENTLPWSYADIHTGIYHSVQQMVGVIRDCLPELSYKHDAMLDEREKMISVFTGAFLVNDSDENDAEILSYANRLAPLIKLSADEDEADETEEENVDKIKLSSGGFVKWICDGLVMPIAGGGLFRAPLLVKTVSNRTTSYQGVLSQEQNLSFALDWSRNIASAVRAVQSGRELRYPASGVDVKIEPFKAEATDQGISRISGYIDNVGYPVSQLHSLLFVLATTDPGKWYIGAVRETDKTVSPEVHAFNECVAFFPYFDEYGRFNCDVFANCDEIDMKKFILAFQNDFIHLTRLNSSDYFFPTRISAGGSYSY